MKYLVYYEGYVQVEADNITQAARMFINQKKENEKLRFVKRAEEEDKND